MCAGNRAKYQPCCPSCAGRWCACSCQVRSKVQTSDECREQGHCTKEGGRREQDPACTYYLSEYVPLLSMWPLRSHMCMDSRFYHSLLQAHKQPHSSLPITQHLKVHLAVVALWYSAYLCVYTFVKPLLTICSALVCTYLLNKQPTSQIATKVWGAPH